MFRKTAIAALCSAALLLPLTAQADDDRVYLSGMLQYVIYDDARPVGNDFGLHLGIGLPVTETIAFELNLLNRSTDVVPAGELDQTGYGLDALWFFSGRDGALDPYALLGVGRISDDYGATDEDYTSVQLALGLTDDISDNFAFRGEVRMYKNGDLADSTDLAVGVGVLYRFGEPERQAVPAKMAPVAEPAPAPVAAAPVAAAVVVDGDGDGDGVKDSADKCPTTPAGMKVGVDGCELDSDGDGVLDSADQCPGTPAGTKVLANGCPVPKVVKLEGVNFTSGTAEFVEGAQAKLDEAVAALKANPTIGVEIAGHTDSQGDAAANRTLSQRRADAVRDYLLKGGVAAEQVTARGYGEDEPTSSNDTAEGRAANRRVELRVKQ